MSDDRPTPYGGPATTSTSATNSKSIVAIALAFSFPLLGLVFGILALREIGRTGEGGKGFALTGVIVGSLAIVAFLAYIGVIIAFVSAAMSGDLAGMSGMGGF